MYFLAHLLCGVAIFDKNFLFRAVGVKLKVPDAMRPEGRDGSGVFLEPGREPIRIGINGVDVCLAH